jgi:hypothetical protein
VKPWHVDSALYRMHPSKTFTSGHEDDTRELSMENPRDANTTALIDVEK